MPSAVAPTDWTCGRCEVTASFMPEVEVPSLPESWVREKGEVYCLSCRRERAAESGELTLEGASLEERRAARAAARVEFEVLRDPERPDGKIAKACHTSIFSVKKARARLQA